MLSDALSKVFSALADPTRRAIVARLAEGEASVNVLAAPFKMSLPAISKHLKVLERSGLITRGRDAQWRPCRLEAAPMKGAADWLEAYRQYWEGSFERLDGYLRELQTKEKKTMNQTDEANVADRTLVITRVFDAPRPLVFACWTEQQHCEKWFAPRDCTMLSCGGDPRPGGAWHLSMRHPDGELYKAFGEYREVIKDERLVFTHAWEGDDGKPEHWTVVTVEFADQSDGKTLMTFTQGVLRSVESRNGHHDGWTQCFDLLAEHLAKLTP